MSADLSIVIVNWKSRIFLQDCLKSIGESETRLRLELVVIDNASFDTTALEVPRNLIRFGFLQSKVNLGFSGANNVAAGLCHGKAILFLNPDTKVLHGALDAMFRVLTGMPRAGAAGCRLLNSDRSLQTSCVLPFPNLLNLLLDLRVHGECEPRKRLDRCRLIDVRA